MNVRWVDPGARIDAQRGAVVVCIPVYGAHELFVECLQSVLAQTPSSVPILVCDDASPDARSREYVAGLDGDAASEHQIFYARREANVGFPANVNGGFEAAAPADVVILNSDCLVADAWLEGLRDAAYSHSAIATATALTNNGSVLSVPEAGTALAEPYHRSFGELAAAVRAGSLRLRPHLLTAIGHCVYVRRDALELVGEFDLAFTPGYGEEVDFSQRCLKAGLCHVTADEVLVLHHGGASLSSDGIANPVQHRHELMIAARYPYYHDAVRALEADRATPLSRSLIAARHAVRGRSVALDARTPAGEPHQDALELVAALAAGGQARVRLIVAPAEETWWRSALGSAAVEICAVSPGSSAGLDPPADVIHRLGQIERADELVGLGRLGDRLIVSQQDLLDYRNPSNFESFRQWDRYRTLTRRVLASADRVVFSSARACLDAQAEHLVEDGRASVVHMGVDHPLRSAEQPAAPAAGAASLADGVPVMLCQGSDRRHENRLFALRVLDELQRIHGWDGRLVMAGPRMTRGSSREEERSFLARHGQVRDAVIDVGAAGPAETAWLLERAVLVLHPSVDGGLDRAPFEAAEHGVPCLWAPRTALAEVLPDAAAGIVPWDRAATARRALELMRDSDETRGQVQVVRDAAAALRWSTTAERLIEVYDVACESPPAPVGASQRSEALLRLHLSEDALRLVGPYGVLARDLERPLLALATHPQIGQPVFRAIKAGYQVSNRLRRLAGRGDDENGKVDPES